MSMCIYLNFKRGKKIACKIKKKTTVNRRKGPQ